MLATKQIECQSLCNSLNVSETMYQKSLFTGSGLNSHWWWKSFLVPPRPNLTLPLAVIRMELCVAPINGHNSNIAEPSGLTLAKLTNYNLFRFVAQNQSIGSQSNEQKCHENLQILTNRRDALSIQTLYLVCCGWQRFQE